MISVTRLVSVGADRSQALEVDYLAQVLNGGISCSRSVWMCTQWKIHSYS